MYIPRYVVIPTHNRPQELSALVAALCPQVTGIVIIDNASEPEISGRDFKRRHASTDTHITVIRDAEQPPNLSRLWNVGLHAVEILVRTLTDADHWDVAILNDDCVMPADWFDVVSHGLRNSSAAIACTNDVGVTILKTEPDGNIGTRLCGWAFMLRGELGIRADESMRWWWGDTDLDWQARKLGGTLILPGPIVGNTYANQSTTGVLAEQSGYDRATFAAKWGGNPW